MISKSFLILLSLTIAIIIRAFLIREVDEAMAISAVAIGIVMMIHHARWLAEYILPLGFMSYFAKDFKQSGSSAKALEFLGWFALLAMLVLVYREQ